MYASARTGSVGVSILRSVSASFPLLATVFLTTAFGQGSQTPVFSGVPSNLTVQCFSDVPYALMSMVDVVPYGVPSNAVGSVGTTNTLQIWRFGNGGLLELCGPLAGRAQIENAIANGVPCLASVGETVRLATGINGISQGFRDRYDANPIVVLPVVNDFPIGSAEVTIHAFIMGQLLGPGTGTGLNWTIDVKILSVAPPANVTATDDCGVDTNIVFAESQSNPGTSCSNIITRTWTATDFCGNSATATQTIVVADTTPPSISCPAAVTVFSDAGQSTASHVSLGTPTASDNCLAVPTMTNNAPTQFPVGTNEVVWTATDSCGNSAICTQNVIVLDATNFRIISILPQGDDILVTWMMPLGHTGVVQATAVGTDGAFSNNFHDISVPIFTSGSGWVTTNYLDAGAVTNMPACYYRVRLTP